MGTSGDLVRAVWIAYREGDFEAALPLLHDDVEFVPADGTLYSGQDGVRDFFNAFAKRGERFEASPYSFEGHGDHGLVIGHRRITSADGIDGGAFYFVHIVRGGRIARLSAHTTRAAAMRELAKARTAGTT